MVVQTVEGNVVLHFAQNQDEVLWILEWIYDRLPEATVLKHRSYAAAVTSGNDLDTIVAGLAFFDYSGTDIFVVGAIDNPAVLRMNDFASAFGIPFRPPLNVLRVTALVDTTNRRSLTILTKLGFKKEGEIRNYLREDNNGYVLGLTRQDWEDRHGEQKWRGRAASTESGRDVSGASRIQPN